MAYGRGVGNRMTVGGGGAVHGGGCRNSLGRTRATRRRSNFSAAAARVLGGHPVFSVVNWVESNRC
jgi:hypothetical protein